MAFSTKNPPFLRKSDTGFHVNPADDWTQFLNNPEITGRMFEAVPWTGEVLWNIVERPSAETRSPMDCSACYAHKIIPSSKISPHQKIHPPSTTTMNHQSLKENHHDNMMINTTIPPRRSVSFDSALTVIHETIHIDDYTFAEKQRCWMSRSELSRCRSEVRSMAQKIAKRQRRSSSSRSSSSVGPAEDIEYHFSDQQQLIRQIVRREAQLAVFEEQELQWMEGVSDEEQIAFVYQKQTLPSQHQAQKIGIADHHDKSNKDAGVNASSSSPKSNIKRRFSLTKLTRSKSLRLLSSR